MRNKHRLIENIVNIEWKLCSFKFLLSESMFEIAERILLLEYQGRSVFSDRNSPFRKNKLVPVVVCSACLINSFHIIRYFLSSCSWAKESSDMSCIYQFLVSPKVVLNIEFKVLSHFSSINNNFYLPSNIGLDLIHDVSIIYFLKLLVKRIGSFQVVREILVAEYWLNESSLRNDSWFPWLLVKSS